VKKALNNPIGRFETLNEALDAIRRRLEHPFEDYLKRSHILGSLARQKTLDEWLRKKFIRP